MSHDKLPYNPLLISPVKSSAFLKNDFLTFLDDMGMEVLALFCTLKSIRNFTLFGAEIPDETQILSVRDKLRFNYKIFSASMQKSKELKKEYANSILEILVNSGIPAPEQIHFLDADSLSEFFTRLKHSKYDAITFKEIEKRLLACLSAPSGLKSFIEPQKAFDIVNKASKKSKFKYFVVTPK